MVHWIEGKKCPPRLLYRWCAQWLLFSNEQYAQSHSWLDSIWPVSDIQSWNGSLHRISKLGSERTSLRFQKSLKGVSVCGLLPQQAVGTPYSRFVWKQTNAWWVSPLCPPPSYYGIQGLFVEFCPVSSKNSYPILLGLFLSHFLTTNTVLGSNEANV